jgi:hypothetical protein
MKVYISGKMMGLPKEDYTEMFDQAQKYLETLGYEVVNPATFDYDDSVSWSDRLMADLMELKHCDAIYMLPNWRQESNGAATEYYFAKGSGLNVLNVEDNLFEILMKERYAPFGKAEDIVFKKTSDLLYEFSEMVCAEAKDIGYYMHAHGYRTKVLDGNIYWILYEKNE